MAELYAGRGAELYDWATRSDTSEVRELVQLVRGTGARVLELAAGSGRLTVPLGRVAAELMAVDLSDDLLAILERRLVDARLDAVDVVRGDLFAVLPGLVAMPAFDVAVLGTTSVALFDEESRARLAALVVRVLVPGGRFLVSLYEAPAEGSSTALDDGRIVITEVLDSTGRVRTSTMVEHAPDGSVLGEYVGSTHVLSSAQLEEELRAAGFATVSELPVRSGGVGRHVLLVAETAA